LYFTGCTSSYREKNIAKATVNALNKADISFDVLGEEEWCCGSPLLRTGQREKAIEVARHNVEAIKKSGAKTVVTSCAGCYRTLKVDYPNLLGKRNIKFDVIHSSQLFASMINEKKVSLENIGLDVTYHDPCHLGRHMEIYDKPVYEEPRNVLGLIANIHEMPRNRENTWCCGSGGGVKSAFPDFALWTANKRIEEVESVGVSTIVTTCPFCVRNLRDAIEVSNKPLKVIDLMELVEKAIK